MSIVLKNIFFIIYFLLSLNLSAGEKKELILGIPPWGGEYKDVIEQYTAFIEYLAENTNMEVKLTVGIDYDSIGKSVNEGEVDIALLPSSAYVSTISTYKNIKYLCTTINKNSNKTSYSSYIITKKFNNIKDYKDLEGKYFAYVDEKSSSGYIFPKALMINKWKINPDNYFKKVLFLGSHPNVLNAVYNGESEAGAVASKPLNDFLAEKGDVFNILEIIDNIPFDGVIVSDMLEEELVKKIKILMLNLDENTETKDGKKVLEKFPWGGFKEESDAHYDIIRNTNKILKDYKSEK